MTSQPAAQIHDLGYRAFEGERAGVGWAVRSLVVHTFRKALGAKRSARHKVAPAITILLSYAPAFVFVAVAAVSGAPVGSPFSSYFANSSFAMALLTALVIPGLLTTERSNGMLAMYLAAPLTRTTYLLSKWVAVLAVMLLVTLGPTLILLVGMMLVDEPPNGVFDAAELLLRLVVAGLTAGAFFASLGIFVASLTKSRNLATVGIILLLAAPPVILSLFENFNGIPSWWHLGDLPAVVGESWKVILGDRTKGGPGIEARSSPVVVAVTLGYAALMMGAAWWRYHRIEIDR